MQGYEMKGLEDYVRNRGYQCLAYKIGNRFRAKNLLILIGKEEADLYGAEKIRDGLSDFASSAWIVPVLEDTSLEDIEPYLKDVSDILLFKEVGSKDTMKPLIDFGRKIRRRYGIKCYPAALVDLDNITYHLNFASEKDKEITENYTTPIRKVYEFAHDYDRPLVILSIGKESESSAILFSYFIKRFMQKEYFNYFTLIFGDGIEGVRKEDLKNRKAIAFEKDYNETHLNRLKRELIDDGCDLNGLMYFSLYPEPYSEILKN